MLRCFASTVEQRPTLLGEAIALAKDVGQLDQVATRRELGHAPADMLGEGAAAHQLPRQSVGVAGDVAGSATVTKLYTSLK